MLHLEKHVQLDTLINFTDQEIIEAIEKKRRWDAKENISITRQELEIERIFIRIEKILYGRSENKKKKEYCKELQRIGITTEDDEDQGRIINDLHPLKENILNILKNFCVNEKRSIYKICEKTKQCILNN